jgi:hypothetical protein
MVRRQAPAALYWKRDIIITEEWGKTQNGKFKTKKNFVWQFHGGRKNVLYTEYILKKSDYHSVPCRRAMTQNHCYTDGKYPFQVPECQTGRLKHLKY